MPYFEDVAMRQPTRMNGKNRMWLMHSLVCTLALALSGSSLLAQGSIEVDGTVRDKDTNQKLSGVEVTVLQDGQPYDAVRTLGNGKYTLSLDHGADYQLVFAYEDLSVRRVEVNTSSIPEAFRERPFFLNVEMSLFEVPAGFDPSLLDEPIGKVSFDESKEKLDWDLRYTRNMQSRIESALESATESGGAEADEGGDAPATNRAYEEHMRKAEVEFGRGRYEQSINWLERALNEVPGDARAEAMMEEAVELLAEAEEAAAMDADYERLMREGKIQLKRKEWEAARTALESASDLKPDEAEPRELLAEIPSADPEEEVASEPVRDEEEGEDDAASARADRAAQAAADAAAKEEANRRKEYERVIAKADKSFDKQNYAEAKALYLNAANLMPEEQYPVDRAEESDARIVDITQLEGEGEENDRNDEASELDRAYEDKVREGDAAFEAEDWSTAKSAYEAAQDMKPMERYPKNRLRRIASLMEDTEVEGQIDVDTEAMLEASEAEAARAAEEADLLAEEQAALLSAERDAAKEDEALRREEAKAASEASRDRSGNYILALQRASEDDAEAYYRNALDAEIRARAQSVELMAERTEELDALWTGNSHARRSSQWVTIQERTARQAEDEYDDALVRNNRIANLELRVQAQQEIAVDQVTRAGALRRDRLITIERKTAQNREMLIDRTQRYDTFVDSLDRMLRAYADFNRDVRLASVDARIMNYEAVQRKARTHDKVGEGEEARRIDNWIEIKETAQTDEQAKRAAAGEAQLRSATARRKVNDLYSGEPLTADDYKEVKAKEGIRKGVEERSYEEGNALIVERTVRVGNEVNVYRKTVAKHGVYYFKNNQSITKDIWILETFEISD